MGDCFLVCNETKCRKELKSKATVTSCSHIFCIEHGQSATDNEVCPACGQTFSEKYDVIMADLNPTEEHKAMVLTGLSPEKIMDCASRALMFWNYQMYQEKLYKEAIIKNSKQHVAELTDYCDTMTAKLKVDMQRMERNVEIQKKENEEKNKQIHELTMQLSEKTKLTKHLQLQCELMKRKQLTKHISSYDEPPSPTFVPNSDYDPNYEYSQQAGQNRSHKKRGMPAEPETNFVFQPRI